MIPGNLHQKLFSLDSLKKRIVLNLYILEKMKSKKVRPGNTFWAGQTGGDVSDPQLGDRDLLVDPLDGLREHGGHGEVLDLAAEGGVNGRDGVQKRQLGDNALIDAPDGGAGEHAVGGAGVDAVGPVVLQSLRGIAEGAAGVHQIVQENAVPALHLADDGQQVDLFLPLIVLQGHLAIFFHLLILCCFLFLLCFLPLILIPAHMSVLQWLFYTLVCSRISGFIHYIRDFSRRILIKVQPYLMPDGKSSGHPASP